MRQEGEASVEEILESIKKVIARDNRTSAVIERRKRESEGVTGKSDDCDEPAEVLELATEDMVSDEVISDHAPLTTDSARDTMRENLAALAMLAQPSMPPQIVRTGETSLEGMVRDMLRPMLAEWLDAHLPGMVEKMVKDEISRIAGKKG